MMYSLKKLFIHSPGHYIAAVILAVAVGAFRYSTLPEDIDFRFICYEVLSVSGYVTFLIGALLTVSYFGAFDLFGFVFSPGNSGEKRKYRDYAQYSQKKAEKRARERYFFVPYFVVGVVVVLLSLVFA